MHRLITCDDVFEVLTRGPFPTGRAAEDAEVESHLCSCHDCRQLAEALRPAAGLLRECLAEDGLPTFDGTVSGLGAWHDSPWLEDRATVTPGSQSQNYSMWIAHGTRLVAAAMLLGLLVGAIQLIAAVQGGQPSARQLREHLTAAPMPAQCRVALYEGSGADASRENCCSSCHTTAVSVSTRAPMHQLVATSCRSCHE